MNYELKELPIEKVYPNWFQPRKEFDKEKIKELAESVLSNGLINPITVKEWRQGKYLIVSGERRWRAHKVAGLKTIQTIVKTYKDDGQFMVDSLIENVHREDLTPTEKGKFCLKIKKQMKLENNEQVANALKINQEQVASWIDNYQVNKSFAQSIPWKLTNATRTMPKEERKKIFDYAKKENKDSMFIEREFVPVYKKSDEPTKKALLSGKATIEDVKRESIPEPLQKEETANNVVDNILTNLHDFQFNVRKLFEETNVEDLSKSKADKAITTCGLFLKSFKEFINTLRQRGARPDKMILELIKANNGKT